MEKRPFDTAVAHQQLMHFDFDTPEKRESLSALGLHLKELLSRLAKNGQIDKHELACLKIFLGWAEDMPDLQKLLMENNMREVNAQKILQEKSADEKRLRGALAEFGLSIPKSKKDRSKEMKNLYATLYAERGFLKPDGVTKFLRYGHNFGKTYTLSWKTDAKKKREIVRFIREEFFENAITADGVSKALKRAGAKNLPARTS